MISFTIPLEPHGQMRVRHGARLIRQKNGKLKAMSFSYKDKKQRAIEQDYKHYILQHAPSEPLAESLTLGIYAYKQIPKSYSKKKRTQALAQEIFPSKTPDLSNIIKHVEDCCNGIIWKDDKQVVSYLPGTGMYYSDNPRVDIVVAEMTQVLAYKYLVEIFD